MRWFWRSKLTETREVGRISKFNKDDHNIRYSAFSIESWV